MKKKLYYFSILFLIALSGIWAQTAKSKTNSSNQLVQEELLLLREMQFKDSLQKLNLENKLLQFEKKNIQQNQKVLDELKFLKSKDSIRLTKMRQKIDSLKLHHKGYAVQPFQDTLFVIYNNLGSYSAKDRAQAIEDRILDLVDNYQFKTDSLQLINDENGWIISWQDQMLMSVTEIDALWMNQDIKALAEDYQKRIKKAIDTHRDQTSFKKLFYAFLESILIIFLVIALIVSVVKVVSVIKKKIVDRKDLVFKGIYIKRYELISSWRLIRLMWILINMIKWFVILLLVYLALPILLNLFPMTEGYAPVLLEYFTTPIKKIGFSIIGYLPNLFTIIVILILFFYVNKLLKFFANEVSCGALKITGFYADWAKPTYQMLKVFLLCFMLIVVFPYLPGSDSPVFKGVSVFVGILFTFSSAGALGNIVAGMVLTYMRPFSVGDRVKIGEVYGDIIEKSLLVTRIKTIKNEIISIPNSQVLNSHSTNYSVEDFGRGLIIHTTITISYTIPWEKVHELAISAASKVPMIELDPKPFIYQLRLDEFYVSYEINAYTRMPNYQDDIYSDLHKAIMDEFHKAGIELLSPHYRAVRDGSHKHYPNY